ncbi:hypothetical protein ACFORG_23665 [Lutimaribacter marinistellae]|uniref:Uncharacterized protein n=1 Tax=Lutimaribacter marinistellae TaxID=1820329 RepID=A0ABV7TMA1_9RHOB
MTSHTIVPSIWASFGNLLGGLVRDRAHRLKSKSSFDDHRAERDFINDIIWSNPDAYSSELDVQNMLNLYPGKF